MPAQPRTGRSYRQEYLKGEAEDEATIVKVDAKAFVPLGGFTAAVKTKDYTRLEPKLLEHKWYAPWWGSSPRTPCAVARVGSSSSSTRRRPA